MKTFKKQFVCIDIKKAVEGMTEMPNDIKLRLIDGNDTFVKLEYDAHTGNMGIPELLMDGHDVNKDNPKLLNELLYKIGIDDEGTEKQYAEVM
jgi:hypothetical protein